MGDEFLCLHITVGGERDSLKLRFLIPERKFEFGKSGFEVGWGEGERGEGGGLTFSDIERPCVMHKGSLSDKS